jgi:hypothetical protein
MTDEWLLGDANTGAAFKRAVELWVLSDHSVADSPVIQVQCGINMCRCSTGCEGDSAAGSAVVRSGDC